MVILLLFSVNTAEKYSGQKLKSLCTKTPKSYKPTHDELFLVPNHPNVFFGHFIVVSHQYGQTMLKTKQQDPKYLNLPKIETNPK